MFKTTITFENYEGEEITKTLYFRLTQAEIVNAEFNSPDGSVLDMLRKMANEKNMKLIVPLVKRFMLMSYCERQEDGTLLKNQEMRDRFESSDEFSELFMQLISDIDALSEFINNIVPKSSQKDIETMKKYDPDKLQEFIKTGDYAILENAAAEGAGVNAAENSHT